MDKKTLKEIFIKSKKAYQNYQDYVGPYVTDVINNKLEKEATKILTPTELEKITELWEEVENAEKELKDTLRQICLIKH
ncbi:MAG: hypothetical protein KBG30_13300 [Bacteroidales bacterium]|nr:hypothetical protein [Bacteroidales bacterium]